MRINERMTISAMANRIMTAADDYAKMVARFGAQTPQAFESFEKLSDAVDVLENEARSARAAEFAAREVTP